MEMKVPKHPTRCNGFKRYVVQNPDTIASVPSSLIAEAMWGIFANLSLIALRAQNSKV
jgi:hypothetical protein